MKKTFIVLAVLGIVAFFIGLVLVIVGGGFTGGNVNYTDEVFISSGYVQKLEVKVAAGSANVEFYDGENVEIEYQTSKKYGFAVGMGDDGTVRLAPTPNRWINWGWSNHTGPKATVKIPQSLVADLEISIGAGAVTVADGTFKNLKTNVSAGKLTMGNTVCQNADCDVSAGSFAIGGLTCNAIDCEVSAGSAEFNAVHCGNINIDVSAGSATFRIAASQSEYNILVDKSAGSCNVTSQQGTDVGKKIDIDVSAGSVKVYFN